MGHGRFLKFGWWTCARGNCWAEATQGSLTFLEIKNIKFPSPWCSSFIKLPWGCPQTSNTFCTSDNTLSNVLYFNLA